MGQILGEDRDADLVGWLVVLVSNSRNIRSCLQDSWLQTVQAGVVDNFFGGLYDFVCMRMEKKVIAVI